RGARRRAALRTATLSPEACVGRASALLDEMEARRRELTGITPASRADTSWMSFRVEWLDRLRQAESSCGVGAPERSELADLFRHPGHPEDLYTTPPAPYSGEIRPAPGPLHPMGAPAPGGP